MPTIAAVPPPDKPGEYAADHGASMRRDRPQNGSAEGREQVHRQTGCKPASIHSDCPDRRCENDTHLVTGHVATDPRRRREEAVQRAQKDQQAEGTRAIKSPIHE